MHITRLRAYPLRDVEVTELSTNQQHSLSQRENYVEQELNRKWLATPLAFRIEGLGFRV